MTSNNFILKVSNSRKNILDILQDFQGYNVDDYRDFSLSEIDAMYVNNQLDMLVSHKDEEKKTYVKYHLINKPIRQPNIDEFVDDLFYIENVLNQNDTLIIILIDQPNENVINYTKHIYSKQGIFVVFHTIDRLQVNILRHTLVPKMFIIDQQERDEMKQKLNLKDFSQLPEISRFDAQAVAMSMRPGDIGEFIRSSVTALDYSYYRICI